MSDFPNTKEADKKVFKQSKPMDDKKPAYRLVNRLNATVEFYLDRVLYSLAPRGQAGDMIYVNETLANHSDLIVVSDKISKELTDGN